MSTTRKIEKLPLAILESLRDPTLPDDQFCAILNDNFTQLSRVPTVDEVCEECQYSKCSCCGQSLEHGECELEISDPEKCCEFLSAKEKALEKMKEDYTPLDLGTLNVLVNVSRIMAILREKIPLERFCKLYFEEYLKARLPKENIYTEIDLSFVDHFSENHVGYLNNQYVLPEGRREGYYNSLEKHFVDSALRILDDPKCYYAHDAPFVLQDEHLTVLIAVRAEEPDFDDDDDDYFSEGD